MIKLKSREMQIPNGFKFLQPETKWQPRNFSSISTIVVSLINHRKGNQALLAKGWSTDPETVANEVEAFNVRLCQNMGWTQYITSDIGASSFPKPSSPSQLSQSEQGAVASKVRKIWAGVKTINEWLDSNLPGVPAELADKRAATCSVCPKNHQGDWTGFFTAPASEAIKRQLEKAQGKNLSTKNDDKLTLCTVCYCPLKLSVHVPLHLKLAHLSPEVERELRAVTPTCWVISEKEAG